MNYKEHIIKWNQYYLKNKTNVSWGFDKVDTHVVEFVSHHHFQGRKTVLDVGCGYGKNAQVFLDGDFDYTGIDIAKEPIDYAKQHISGGTFLLGDIISSPFTNTFDIIIDAGCFHVNNKIEGKKILEKYASLLSDGGKIFMRVFKSPTVSEEPLFIIDGALPVWGYTREEITDVVSQFFRVEECILDTTYYDEDEIFYLYLSKK